MRVPPNTQHELELSLASGRYRTRIRGQRVFSLLDISADNPIERVVWRDSDRGNHVAATTSATMVLHNSSPLEQTFIVEEFEVDRDALRPADLFTLQDFRDLFSEDGIAQGLCLDVGSQTVLFTDVVGSTRFYEAQGDSAAFAAVHAMFEVGHDVVRQNRGAIVKTIGDAMMAAFERPADGLRAALELQRRYPHTGAENPLRLRVSLHAGPCLAVRLNSNIDYFGATVNLAAKLQAVTEGGQISFSMAVRQAHHVEEILRSSGLRIEEIDHELPWSGARLAVHRVQAS